MRCKADLHDDYPTAVVVQGTMERRGKRLKTLIIFLLLSGVANAEWKDRDKILMGSYIVLNAMDAYQTAQCNRKNLQELNPLFVDGDNKVDMGKVIGYKIFTITAVYLLAEYAEKYRTPILSVAVGIQGAVVAWNLQF